MNATAASAERWFHIGPHLVGVTDRRSRVFSRHRDLDWAMAILALVIGGVLFWPGVMIRVGSEGSWTAGISTHGWATILLSLGALRALAIRINGIWQTSISATIRAGAAFVSMAFWGQILYVAVQNALILQRPSVGLALYFWLWAFEARCIVRALDDAASIKRASKLARSDAGPR